MLEKLDILISPARLWSILHTIYTHRPKYKLKLPEENIGGNIFYLGLGKNFLDVKAKPKSIKENIINWTSVEFKSHALREALLKPWKYKPQPERRYVQTMCLGWNVNGTATLENKMGTSWNVTQKHTVQHPPISQVSSQKKWKSFRRPVSACSYQLSCDSPKLEIAQVSIRRWINKLQHIHILNLLAIRRNGLLIQATT